MPNSEMRERARKYLNTTDEFHTERDYRILAAFATLERAEARREQIIEDCKSQCQYCAGVKDELESVNSEPYWTEKKYFCNSGELEGFIHATSWGTAVSCDASALRSKLAAPEKAETKC